MIPNRPVLRDVLQAFRQLAPDPPGVIMDSGQDAASPQRLSRHQLSLGSVAAIERPGEGLRGYLRKNAGATLQKGSDEVTRGFVSEPPAKPAAFSPRQPKREPAPPPVAEKPVGEFARMFHDSDPKPVPVADERSPLVQDLSPNQPASQRGSFSREFFASAPPAL